MLVFSILAEWKLKSLAVNLSAAGIYFTNYRQTQA
jgi:hypothetical protein